MRTTGGLGEEGCSCVTETPGVAPKTQHWNEEGENEIQSTGKCTRRFIRLICAAGRIYYILWSWNTATPFDVLTGLWQEGEYQDEYSRPQVDFGGILVRGGG